MDTETLALGQEIVALLASRKQTIAIAESSTGGLIAATLLAVPGASAAMRGGGVIYTGQARAGLLGLPPRFPPPMRPSTEPYALLLAQNIRERLDATWGVGETGATGPSGNSYGDAPGQTCFGIAGPAEAATTLETGQADRVGNMKIFTFEALRFVLKTLKQFGPA
jgi:nicotinamide-nucleotide amidase